MPSLLLFAALFLCEDCRRPLVGRMEGCPPCVDPPAGRTPGKTPPFSHFLFTSRRWCITSPTLPLGNHATLAYFAQWAPILDPGSRPGACSVERNKRYESDFGRRSHLFLNMTLRLNQFFFRFLSATWCKALARMRACVLFEISPSGADLSELIRKIGNCPLECAETPLFFAFCTQVTSLKGSQ